ncbi:redoxin domain-containing protein [Galenea microaerophila]
MDSSKKTIKRYPLKTKEYEDLERETPLPDELPFFKRRWVKNTLWAMVIVVLYLSLRHFQQGDVIKTQVPPVQLQTLTGEVIDLSKPQPKPYLIHFWGTWCPICNYQHDAIRRLSEKYTVIAIAVKSTSEDELRKFSDENFIPKNIIVNDLDGDLMTRFKVSAVPTDLYVMPDGRIKFVEVGFTSYFGFWIRLWWLEHFG